jgi:hypothetical protein
MIKDMTGSVCGRLTVVERSHSNNEKAKWLCRCCCGNMKIVLGDNLRSGHTISCGCAGYGSRTEDLSGKIFGDLLVTDEFFINDRHQVKWRCKCGLCGKFKDVFAMNLKSGATKSCGCNMTRASHKRHLLFNGIKYRSSYEVFVAACLDALTVSFLYEPVIFDLAVGKYIPDFHLTKQNIWIEVKGFASYKSIEKFKSFHLNKKLMLENDMNELRGSSIRSFAKSWSKRFFDQDFVRQDVEKSISRVGKESMLLLLEQPHVGYS